VIGALFAIAACGGGPKPRHDSAANAPGVPEALAAAVAAMKATSGFHFVAEVRLAHSTVHVEGAYLAPDRLQETVTPVGGTPTELLFVGDRRFFRDATGWHASSEPTGAESDPRAAFEVLNAATVVGSQNGSYDFSVTGAPARRLGGQDTKTVTGTVVVTKGVVASLTYSGDGTQPPKVTVSYTDVGSQPSITVPSSSPR
jgi:hypothetical protein